MLKDQAHRGGEGPELRVGAPEVPRQGEDGLVEDLPPEAHLPVNGEDPLPAGPRLGGDAHGAARGEGALDDHEAVHLPHPLPRHLQGHHPFLHVLEEELLLQGEAVLPGL